MRQVSLTGAQFFAVLREIGLTRADLEKCVHEPEGLEAKQAAVAAFRDTVRKAFMQRVFEVHPDRNPDNPKAEELCKALNVVRPAFMKCVDSIRVIPPQPQREVIHHVRHHWPGRFSMWVNSDEGATATATNSSKWVRVQHFWNVRKR